MVSKNNHQFYQQNAERKQRWGIRKLSVGVASVLLGTTFMLYSNHAVLADTVTSTSDVTRSTATDKGQGKTLTEMPTGTDKQANGQKVNQKVPTTDTEEKVVATNPKDAMQGQNPTQGQDTTQDKGKQTNTQDTTQDKGKQTNTQDTTQDKDKQTNANETTQNATNVGNEVMPANGATPLKKFVLAALPVRNAETPDPTVPDNSANTAIINNQKNLANDWMQLEQGKLKIYLTARGLDNKIYVSSYADAREKTKSMIISNRLDPNSLEIHVDFENTDVKQNIATLFGWDTKVMQIDTSRLGTDGIVAYGKSGKKYQIGLNHDGGNYDYYQRMVELHKDISQVGALYMTDPIEANDTISTTIPVKYVGNKKQTTSIFPMSLS